MSGPIDIWNLDIWIFRLSEMWHHFRLTELYFVYVGVISVATNNISIKILCVNQIILLLWPFNFTFSDKKWFWLLILRKGKFRMLSFACFRRTQWKSKSQSIIICRRFFFHINPPIIQSISIILNLSTSNQKSTVNI